MSEKKHDEIHLHDRRCADASAKQPDILDMIKQTEECLKVSPETEAWLNKIAAAHDRMSTDEEYRKASPPYPCST